MASSKQLHEYIVGYFAKNNMDQCLAKEFPKKWEKYGDFVLFDRRLFTNNMWLNLNLEFWEGVCDVLKCSRLGLKGVIINNNFRSPDVLIVLGDDPWICHTDNGVKYTWNVHKNMFSAGNAPERHRIAKLNCREETIVDMFAGIGYFTLPYLVHAKANYVYSCEWNPFAVTALKKALVLNKVENRCEILEGDCTKTSLIGIADRVNLGLIPSSEIAWNSACRILKKAGGILVVHGNVETLNDYQRCSDCQDTNSDIKWKHKNWYQWGCHVLHTLQTKMTDNHGVKYKASVIHVHFVKSYAPHVDHLVLDIKFEAIHNV